MTTAQCAKKMKSGTPGVVELLAVLPWPVTKLYAKERELHRQFAVFRHHGEWFRLDPQILEFIESIAEETV